MEGRRLGVFSAWLCGALACSVWGAEAPARIDRQTGKDATSGDVVRGAPAGAGPYFSGLETYDIPRGVPMRTVYVGGGGAGSVVAGPTPGERLIYSNTLGYQAINAGTGLIADDLTTTAPNGCKLTHYAFEITGRSNPANPGGPYSVSWALYTVCPGAVSSTSLPSRRIAGTEGSLTVGAGDNPDDPRTIVHTVADPAGVAIPTNVWLGLQFNRTNAGPILGAPAEVGFSYDIFQYPGLSCEANQGDFPEAPHASFNVQLWAGTELEPCPDASIGYHAHREKILAEASFFNPGIGKWVVDDLTLQHSCRMIGYEVTISGQGTYNFEFRNSCDAQTPIAGTARSFNASSTNNQTRNVVFTMDNPINLPTTVFFAASISNAVGKVLAGTPPLVGESFDSFEIQDGPGAECVLQNAITSADDALSVTVICEGLPPLGACCDMFVPECVGGPDDGEGCRTNAHCTPPGTCERQCRQLPEANCTFPPNPSLLPAWQQGDACEPDPFPDIPACGVAACCHGDDVGRLDCVNLTENQCNAIPPLEAVRQWQIGKVCGLSQRCPLLVCLGKTNSCFVPGDCPDDKGCGDPDCCSEICENFDDFCCNNCWDATCSARANTNPECTVGNPPYDRCWSDQEDAGALLIDTFPTQLTILTSETEEVDEDDPDPPLCCQDKRCKELDDTLTGICTTDADCAGRCITGSCRNGARHGQACTVNADCPAIVGACFAPHWCVGGDNDRRTCTKAMDCPAGACEPRPAEAVHTSWFKFVGPPPGTSILINTCQTSGGAPKDSVIQVFAPQDTSSDRAACASLAPVGCNDDNVLCNTDSLSRLCLNNLVPGQLYYVMVGAKTKEAGQTDYSVQFSDSCNAGQTVANDWCGRNPVTVNDGNTAFAPNWNLVTLDCPGDSAAPTMTKDIWYNYTATCTGNVYVKTCQGSNPDTTLCVYKDCDCPDAETTTPFCNDNNNIAGLCPAGSLASGVKVTGVKLNDCLKIRLGNKNGNAPTGTMNIFCEPVCEDGAVTFLDPQNGVVDARWPHDPLILDPTLGIQEIRVQGPVPGVNLPECWVVNCETARPGEDPNAIESVIEDPMAPGTYIVRLTRPITTEAFTRLWYSGNPDDDNASLLRMTAHPGNATGDVLRDVTAILVLVNAMNAINAGDPAPPLPPWGMYGADMDHSRVFTCLDVLGIVDVFNCAETFACSPIPRPSSPPTAMCLPIP